MIFYSTIKVISLSLYALIRELYIYDKLFHKLTIKKKLKRIKRSWKHRGLCLLSLWTQTVFLMKFLFGLKGSFIWLHLLHAQALTHYGFKQWAAIWILTSSHMSFSCCIGFGWRYGWWLELWNDGFLGDFVLHAIYKFCDIASALKKTIVGL